MWEGLKNYILGTIMDMFQSIQSLGTDSYLSQSPGEFSKVAYDGIALVRDNVVAPVAYTILALFLILELHHVATRAEGVHGTMGIELPLKVLFKMILCKVATDNAGLIMDATYAVSIHLIEGISDSLTAGSGGFPIPNYEEFEASVENLSKGELLMASVKVSIVELVVSGCILITQVIVLARFFVVFIYMAIAPLPVATLPHNELSSIAKNFLKNFAAVALHGVFIYLALSLFLLILRGNMIESLTPSGAGDINAILWGMVGYTIVLIVTIFATSRWAKSICNAM